MNIKIHLFLIGLIMAVPNFSWAQWGDCLHGEIGGSCEYPGECGRYIDTNQDRICDHSQKEPAMQTLFKKERENIADNKTNEVQILNGEVVDNSKIINEKISEKIKTTSLSPDKNIDIDVNKVNGKNTQKHKKAYPFLSLVIILTVVYLVTYLLARKKIIKVITHKKIWNILLTISFLALAVTSVLLIIQINSGNTLSPGFNILYWHVIAGIIMITITFFHIGWHWRYYWSLIK